MKKRRKGIIAAVLALCALAYGVRVWQLNAADQASAIPVEHYAMGQWVDLSGSYLRSADQAPDGYAVKIDKAELLTPDEYVEKYGAAGAEMPGEDGEKTVLSLEYEIRHEGDGPVGLVLFEQKVLPQDRSIALSYDRDLWWQAEPSMKGQPGQFGLRPDSSYTAHIPFSFIDNPPAFQSYVTSPRTKIDGTAFELLLSNLPTRKVIDVALG